MFEQTVTVYHRERFPEGERWPRTVVEGVHFAPGTGERVTRAGRTPDDAAILLVPMREGRGCPIRKGDKLMEGVVPAEVVRSPSELRPLGEVFQATEIKALPFGGLAHWKVMCNGVQPGD